ncbi:glycosyltransferase family 4 protein [Paracoccus benzoatiresistens]|uniref:Glycosyltransferase family 4 protein n=1 Tax=Paracoccus benzoatiresistens TaxID=2997341 RepID=A0ABT4J0K1_9RHOB|nr:glycosyltransferase family 4 protein [Paracoccus sp. EF6]MCZ0960646.1 glycosyltransferase family 4 protein [Paracoccus sp. EF6]
MTETFVADNAFAAAGAVPRRRRKVVVIASLGWSLINFRLELLRRIQANGHDLLVLSPEIDEATATALRAERIRFVQIPMSRTGVNPVSDLVTLSAILRILLRERPDLVLPYTLKPIVYGALAGRLAGVRTTPLFTGLGYAFNDPAPEGRRRVIRDIVVRLHRLALRKVTVAFCYNDAEERDIRAFGLVPPHARLVRVPGSGVDTRLFQASEPPTDPVRFLFVGRLLKSKGVEILVEAARLLRAGGARFELCLLGPTDSNPDAVSAETLAAWRAEGIAELPGATRDVRPWLAGASVFVLPTMLREGVPRSILEAMSTGRAVITTDAPGCGSTISDGVSGFVVPAGDVAALAAAMRRFIKAPGLITQMGRAARAEVAANNDVHDINRLILTTIGLEDPVHG